VNPSEVPHAPAPEYTGTLQAVALPMPPGARRESLRMGTADGSLDLAAVLEEYQDADRPAIRELLTDMTFERGLFLAWINAQKVSVYLQVYQFGSAGGAKGWLAAQIGSLQPGADSSGELSDIPEGRWFTTTTPDGRKAVHAVYCQGDLWVGMSTFTAGTGDLKVLTRLATDQYRLLP
jgi:hypothetical protein